MKPDQISFFQSLDPQRMNCTVQDILMRPDILQLPYHSALEWLVKQTLVEKDALQTENQVLSSVLKNHGLYTRDNILPLHEAR